MTAIDRPKPQTLLLSRPLSGVFCLLSSVFPRHLSRTLYKSNLFMQNKPNFKSKYNDSKMLYANDLYQNLAPSADEKQTQNKPNSKKKRKMNLTPYKEDTYTTPKAPGFTPGVLPGTQTADQFRTGRLPHPPPPKFAASGSSRLAGLYQP